MGLYVKAGYYNENPDQMEFAHIIEHLAFTNAKHFPVSIKGRLKKLNIKDRATTGDMCTRYNLNFPSNHLDTLDVGFLWFRDMADLKLTGKAIDRERGILRQETIFKVGYRLEEYFQEQKLFSRLFACKPDVSKLMGQLQDFSSDSLIEFYKTWYRPERMGLVIVGNIKDIDAIENHIEKRFSDIPLVTSPLPESIDCRWDYLNSPNRFVIQGSEKWGKDKASARLYLFYRDRATLSLQNNSKKGLHRNLIWSALRRMVRQRIRDEQISETFIESPKPWFPFYQIIIHDDANTEEQKLQKITKLIQQIKAYGFNKKEWKEAQAEILQQLGDTTNTVYWKDQMYNHFIYQEALPENKREDIQQWLIKLSLEEINAYADQYLSAMPNDIGVLARDGHKALSYTESEVRGWIQDIIKAPVEPYEQSKENVPESLLSSEEIAALKEVEYTSKDVNKIGLEELILSNGVRVVLHHQKLSGRLKGRILIHGFSPKGALCFPESDYFSAINAPMVIKTVGLGNMNGQKLQKFISSNNFYLNTYVNPLETGIELNVPSGDMEKILQLVYLVYSKPKYPDKSAFERWKEMESNNYSYPYMIPKSIDFKVAIAEVLNDKSVVLLPGGRVRYEGMSQVNKGKAYEIYHQLFGKASDFTFVISGDFSRGDILPIVQKYLGNLPNSSNEITCSKITKEQTDLPKSPFYKEFLTNEIGTSYRMQGSLNYMLSFMNKMPNSYEWKEHIKVKLLGNLINDKLKSFRYGKGASLYNFDGYSKYNRYFKAYNLIIYMDCTEQEFEWLREESKKLIADIKENGFDPETFRRIQERSYKVSLDQGLKPKEVYEHYRYNDPFVNKKEQAYFIKRLTMKDIQETAKEYLKEENMMEFVLKDGVSP